jgi:hypothetical protein
MAKKSEKKRICGNCIFCGDLIDTTTKKISTEAGQCRRLPPQIVVMNIKAQTVHPGGKSQNFQMAQPMQPSVNFDTPGCGEHRFGVEISP